MEGLLDVAIVPAGPADAADLARVHVKSWRETYPGLLPAAYLNAMRPEPHARRFHHDLIRSRDGEVVMLAEGQDGLIGYCAGAILHGDGRLADGEVYTLYVLAKSQGAGIGKGLLAAAARVLAAHGAASLIIWVLSENHRARRFYQHLGGRELAERAVRGWGGGLRETAYHWDGLRKLTA